MFGPWLEILDWFRSLRPRKWPAFKPNFIWLHYAYIIFMTLLGSIMIYPAGGMRYIDALFFASGSATQSGLNTIDVNNLNLYQQIVLYMTTFVCTPIFIHSFVVFVRLYWFEKRFQGVFQEARKRLRAYRTKSKSRNDNDEEQHANALADGVNGRKITVVRASDEGAGDQSEVKNEKEKELESSNTSNQAADDGAISPSSAVEGYPTFHRDILFADEQPKSTRKISNSERMPEQRPASEHIAFVESQRQKDKGTLRIPDPRGFDLGEKPENISDSDDTLQPSGKAQGDEPPLSAPPAPIQRDSHLIWDDNALKKHATARDGRMSQDGDESPVRTKVKSGFSALTSPFSFGHHRGDSNVIDGLRQRRTRSFTTQPTSRSVDRDPMPYLSWQPTIGRNSMFVDLTEEQREELGGIEYRALKTLAFVLCLFYVGFHVFGIICLVPWIQETRSYHGVLESAGVNKTWWGFFTSASMFNDLGFTLTPDSMISFQRAIWPLMLGSFLIIIGNTGFPCMLRFVIWTASRLVPTGSAVWEELRFLLDHPRRCFTLLFPADATWWLFWVLVLLNGVDLIFFIILDLNDPTVTDLPPGIRVLDGWFQAASTRTAGFSVVNLADLHPAIQVSYLIMMYISVFPIAISLRRTNVYEEKSLGVYRDDEQVDQEEKSYVGHHLRRQLSFDLWYVFLGFFLIAIIEGGRLENTNDIPFTLFSVLFEIISAYGTVGLSLGYTGVNTSFSGQFRTLSKLIIIAMQIRGRHRGLPYALDRAILLPSDSLHKKEQALTDRLRRQRSNLSEMAVAEGIETGDGAPSSPQMNRRMSGAMGGRRGSNATINRERPSNALSRLVSGALSAGPTIPKDFSKNA